MTETPPLNQRSSSHPNLKNIKKEIPAAGVFTTRNCYCESLFVLLRPHMSK